MQDFLGIHRDAFYNFLKEDYQALSKKTSDTKVLGGRINFANQVIIAFKLGVEIPLNHPAISKGQTVNDYPNVPKSIQEQLLPAV